MAKPRINKPSSSINFPPENFRSILRNRIPLTVLVSETQKFKDTISDKCFDQYQSFTDYLNSKNPFLFKELSFESIYGPASVTNHSFRINFIDCDHGSSNRKRILTTPSDIIVDYWDHHSVSNVSFFDSRLITLTVATSADSREEIVKATSFADNYTYYAANIMNPLKIILVLDDTPNAEPKMERVKNLVTISGEKNFDRLICQFLSGDFTAILTQQVRAQIQHLMDQYRSKKKKGFMKIFSGNSVQRVESIQEINHQAIYSIEKYLSDLYLFFGFYENAFVLYRTIASEYKSQLPSLFIAKVYELQAISGIIFKISDTDSIDRLEKAYLNFGKSNIIEKTNVRMLICILIGLADQKKAVTYIKTSDTPELHSPIFDELSAYFSWGAMTYNLAVIEFIKSFIQWYDLGINKRAVECLEAILALESVIDHSIISNCRLLRAVITEGDDLSCLKLVDYHVLYNSSNTHSPPTGLVLGPIANSETIDCHPYLSTYTNGKKTSRVNSKLSQLNFDPRTITHASKGSIVRDGDCVSIMVCLNNDFVTDLTLNGLTSSISVKYKNGTEESLTSAPFSIALKACNKALVNFSFRISGDVQSVTAKDLKYTALFDSIFDEDNFFDVVIPEKIRPSMLCENFEHSPRLRRHLNDAGLDTHVPSILVNDNLTSSCPYDILLDSHHLYECEMATGSIYCKTGIFRANTSFDVKTSVPVIWNCEAERHSCSHRKRLTIRDDMDMIQFSFMSTSEPFLIFEISDTESQEVHTIVYPIDVDTATYPSAKWGRFAHINDMNLNISYQHYFPETLIQESLVVNSSDYSIVSCSVGPEAPSRLKWALVAKIKYNKFDQYLQTRYCDTATLLIDELHFFGSEFRMRIPTALVPVLKKEEDMAFISTSEKTSSAKKMTLDHVRQTHFGVVFKAGKRTLLLPGLIPPLKSDSCVFYALTDHEKVEKAMQPIEKELKFYNFSGTTHRVTVWLTDNQRNYIWLGPTKISFDIDTTYTLKVAVLFYQAGNFTIHGIKIYVDKVEVKKMKALTISVKS